MTNKVGIMKEKLQLWQIKFTFSDKVTNVRCRVTIMTKKMQLWDVHSQLWQSCNCEQGWNDEK